MLPAGLGIIHQPPLCITMLGAEMQASPQTRQFFVFLDICVAAQ